MHKKYLPLIAERMKGALPGWEAQNKMSPLKTKRYLEHPLNAKQASVLAILYPDVEDNLNLIFIERAKQKNDKHSGQISFPGGQREEKDIDLEFTALRETFEEIGIPKADIKILGQLTPLYVFVSNFYVFPFVAYLNEKPNYIIEKTEVAQVIESEISYLISEKSKFEKDFKVRGNLFSNMPYYKVGGKILWGATAMITAELLHILHEI